MASISTNKQTGLRKIEFVQPDGKKMAIRMGRSPMSICRKVAQRVEYLVAAKESGSAIDTDTAAWIAKLDGKLRMRLAELGLCDPPAETTRTSLKAFLDDYIAKRGDVKDSTTKVFGHTKRNLIEYFGAGKSIREIKPGDADEWRLWLTTNEKLGEATVRRRSGIAKQFFKAAVRKGLLKVNPFQDLKSAVQGNSKRFYFVSRDEAQKVLDACPDAQWKLLFALSRYAGLRCPSEHVLLTWADVDWERGRFTVYSKKNERHEESRVRVIPIFPELYPYLKAARDEARPGTVRVITMRDDATTNLRTGLEKIIIRAGLKPWPKLFQNLRSTRETELAETFPVQVVCKWIGNSPAIAAKHYLQVTDDHYAAASAGAAGNVTRNVTQKPTETAGSQVSGAESGAQKTLKNTGIVDFPDVFEGCVMGNTGLEPVTPTV